MKIESETGFHLNIASVSKAAESEQAATEMTLGSSAAAEQNNAEAQPNPPVAVRHASFSLDVAVPKKNAFGGAISGIVEMYKQQTDSEDSYAARTLAGMKAATAVGNFISDKVSEEQSSQLEKERKETEEETEQKLAEKAAEANKQLTISDDTPVRQNDEAAAAVESSDADVVRLAAEGGASSSESTWAQAGEAGANAGETESSSVDIVV